MEGRSTQLLLLLLVFILLILILLLVVVLNDEERFGICCLMKSLISSIYVAPSGHRPIERKATV